MALFDKPLFENEIQAWRYGPICPPAYKFYSEFEAKQLPIPDEDVLSEFPDKTKDFLEKVWGCFSGYNAYFLSAMTHAEFPWKNARKWLSKEATSTESILFEDMEALGQDKFNGIEHKQPRTPGLLKGQQRKQPRTPGLLKGQQCKRVHLTLENVSSGKLTIEISTAKRKNKGNALNIPLCSR